jgi:Zn-dependent protease with chaperone function
LEHDAHPHRKLIGLVWIAAVLSIAFICANGLPYLASQIPLRYEQHLANWIGDPLGEMPACSRTPPEPFQRLIKRLYPLNETDRKIPIEVRFIKSEEVNAFAYLGGRVFVFSGLLKQAESPEELAGVLAHEFEHVSHRHIMQGLVSNIVLSGGLGWIFGSGPGGKIMTQLVALKFTKSQEAQADHDALLRLRNAKIDRRGFIHFFEKLEKESNQTHYLSDHPSNLDRIQKSSQSPAYESTPIMTREEWLRIKTICP